MIVHKFGGTSVGDARRIANVADIVISHHQQRRQSRDEGQPLPETIVLVSAMSGVTDQLITGGWAAAEGKDSVYREVKARLLQKHLEVVESLVNHSPERLDGRIGGRPPARPGAPVPQHCHAG